LNPGEAVKNHLKNPDTGGLPMEAKRNSMQRLAPSWNSFNASPKK